jgi:hypothetical protein
MMIIGVEFVIFDIFSRLNLLDYLNIVIVLFIPYLRVMVWELRTIYLPGLG